MNKPLIGVTPLWDEEKDSLWMLPGYMNGIEKAGGIPVMLPLCSELSVIDQIAHRFDGFLFTGGQDVSPELYKKDRSTLCGPTCRMRDDMEARLFSKAILELNKPALGICRGIQLFNVLLGGTLYQDIQGQWDMGKPLNHIQSPPYSNPIHKVTIFPDSPLFTLLQRDEIMVNSYHHQGVKKLAPPLASMAVSTDGLVEAAYMPGKKFVWAVQWHPEFSLPDESSQDIFLSFVTACGIKSF